MLWIKEVLILCAGTIQRFAQTRKTDRGRQAKRRTLVVIEERYVVVFNDPDIEQQALPLIWLVCLELTYFFP